jgi:hypothetical protein
MIDDVHIMELRSGLAAARQSLLLSALTYTDHPLGPSTIIKAAHLNELRGGVK